MKKTISILLLCMFCFWCVVLMGFNAYVQSASCDDLKAANAPCSSDTCLIFTPCTLFYIYNEVTHVMEEAFCQGGGQKVASGDFGSTANKGTQLNSGPLAACVNSITCRLEIWYDFSEGTITYVCPEKVTSFESSTYGTENCGA